MSERWYVADEGRTTGPFDMTQTRALLARSPQPSEVQVCREGAQQWQRAGDVPGLVPEQLAPPPVPVAPAAAARPMPSFPPPRPARQPVASKPTPQGFKPHIAVAILIAVAAALAAFATILGASSAGSDRVAETAGAIVGAVLIPLGVGWIAYRLAGRSHLAGNIVAGILGGLLVLGGLVRVAAPLVAGQMKSSVTQSAAQDISDQAEAMRVRASEELAKDGEYTSAGADMERFVATASKAAAEGGSESAMFAGAAVTMKRLQVAQASYQQALDAFLAAGSIDPSGLVGPAALADRRALLETFCSENAKLAETARNFVDNLRADVLASGATAEQAEATVRGARSTYDSSVVLRIRKLDADMCVSMRGILDVLGAASWEYDPATQMVMFAESTPDTMLDNYNQHLADIDRLSTEQTTLQQQLLAAK